jgi:ethanolamine permease
MAVFGAVLAYVLQMASFILLRRNAPGMARPFTSRLGIPGALAAAALAILTLAALFANPDYRIGVWGAAVWFVCGVAYFAFYARHRLILSPEEEFALALASEAAELTPVGLAPIKSDEEGADAEEF